MAARVGPWLCANASLLQPQPHMCPNLPLSRSFEFRTARRGGCRLEGHKWIHICFGCMHHPVAGDKPAWRGKARFAQRASHQSHLAPAPSAPPRHGSHTGGPQSRSEPGQAEVGESWDGILRPDTMHQAHNWVPCSRAGLKRPAGAPAQPHPGLQQWTKVREWARARLPLPLPPPTSSGLAGCRRVSQASVAGQASDPVARTASRGATQGPATAGERTGRPVCGAAHRARVPEDQC